MHEISFLLTASTSFVVRTTVMSVKAKHVLGFTQINVILVVVRVTCPKYKRKLSLFYLLCSCKGKGKGNGKGKANPSQAWAGPEVSSRLSLPDFKTIGT